ncbi:PAS domain S-box protein [Natronolimnohabitans sp. A-GB9]|uniref:PAS domain S-box protein n=1 Tax=Natronolimnohabitans sp. A-GB9 TaxID=3069757 RepID=UPI0027AEC95B|nr:PAS domain S-box protein [Natronolimnohabitans sp. A-GB9]MDQ2051826.1 PAS domain S-box protein [Natronolimnohabitans sp. A-GB9]
MAVLSSRGGSTRWTTVRCSPLAVVAVIFVVGWVFGSSAAVSGWLESIPFPGVPVLLFGLAARGDPDREGTIEGLCTELESFVSTLRDGEDDESVREQANRVRDVAAAVEHDGEADDELDRLTTVIDELTTATAEREREFAQRKRDLRSTNERLSATIEATPSALIAVDLEGTVELWNPAAERIFGWSEDEILGEPLPIIPEHRRDEVDRFREQLEADEPITGVETQRRTKDGSLIDVRLSKAPIHEDGEIVGAMAALEDITDRKESDRRLESTRAHLEALFEHSPDMIDVLDPDGTLVDVNRQFCEQLGYTESELLGTKIWEYDRSFTAAEVRSLLADISTGDRRKFEGQYQRRDGSTFPVEIHLIRIDLADKDRFIVISRDITDRKERERTLRERDRRLRTLMSNVPGLVYRCRNEPGWPFEFVSDGCVELTGYEPEQLVDGDVNWIELLDGEINWTEDVDDEIDWTDDVSADQQDEIWETIQQIIDEQGSLQMTYPIETADGERRWVSERGRGVFDDGGSLEAMEGVITDVTDRVESEQELERITRMLEQSQRLANIGAWELDVREEPYDLQWTDEIARIHGYSEPPDIELPEAIELYHPDDQDELRSAVEQTIETGEMYDLELRLQPFDDGQRWVRAIGEAIEEDGEVVKLQGSLQDITDRKQRERSLQETKRRLELALEGTNTGIWELNVETNELDWNDTLQRIVGLEPGEFEGTYEDFIERVHPEDVPRIEAALERAIENDELYRDGFRLRHENGDWIWVGGRGRLVVDEDGTRRMVGINNDITERKRLENELERTLDRVSDAFHAVDTEWNFTYVNTQARELLDAEDRDLIGNSIWEEFPSAVDSRFEEEYRRAMETQEAVTFEEYSPVVDAWVEVNLYPSESGLSVYFRDITDRKERERELERYETIIQSIGDPVYTLDASGDVRFINDAIESLAGYDPESLIGNDISEILPPEELERAQDAVRELLRGEKTYNALETEFVTADGERIETETHIALLPTDDGEFTGTAGVIRDITKRKERERELERTRDLLERVQRMAKVGGWELAVDTEPRTAIWTDEMYRLHALPRDVTPDLERTIECYHPDDRQFVRDRLETAVATETRYELEGRLQSDDGDVRWVHAMGEPIYDDDGSLIKYRGTVKDISDRKRRELALESLHETARELLSAETESTVADLVVDTAADLLEFGDASAGVYLLDDDTNRFEPVASTAAFAERTGGAPSVAVGDGDSLLWSTYVTGTQTVVDDAVMGNGSPLFGGDAAGGLLVPIGDHGVFVLVASPATIGDETRRLFETLVATTEAAFDRLESEATLRERDAELESQNRRLRRQIEITEIIRGIDQSLIGADSRTEIERTVPERLVEADTVDFAWMGDLDASGTELEARSWAGADPEYLDVLSLDIESESAEPSVRTARSNEPTVVENVVEDLQREPWRRDAIDAGFQSVLSVPITFEEYSYGVLTVYAKEADAFTDLERTVFTELGAGIANAITAAKTQEALHSETLVELTLELTDDDDVLSRIASTTGATVTYEGLGSHSSSETVLFFETSDVDPDAVREALADLVSVTEHRLVTESDDGCLFEATVTGDVVASRLVRHGGSPRSIVADGERTAITVDVPTQTDVREFVAMLQDHYPAVELRSRQHVQRAMHTRQELVTSLFEPLTDRQREVLRTAYLAGFFEWPRESTGEEIAEMLEVTQPTVNRHLRIGQQRLLKQLFGAETLSLAD